MSDDLDKLPTILEVLEKLSKQEIDESVKMVGHDFMRMDVGTYNVVSREEGKNIPMLFPNSTSPMTFYRGQNKLWDNCVPNIYRKRNDAVPFEDYIIINRIKMAEFFRIVLSHPVVQDFSRHYFLDTNALAQHYGFSTDYLDVTNDKWVAAFFACTQYEDGQYIPVGRDFEDGVGVMYVSVPPILLASVPEHEGLFSRLNVIGFQYFQRPSRQNAFFYKMNKDENFNNVRWFYKIRFKHDINASRIVYNMSYKQRKFFPDDQTSIIANTILNKSYKISWESVKYAKVFLDVDKSDSDIEQVLSRSNIPWHTSAETNIKYDTEQMNKEWNDWNRFGRADLIRRINSILPVAKL